MEQKDGQVNSLLEDGWFFGNSLLSSRSKSSKIMVRCNSDPCPSSSTKEPILVSNNQEEYSSSSKMSNLFRTPSLPPCFGREKKYGEEEEEDNNNNDNNNDEVEDEEPRMGDLIRQAMPMPSCKRLDRIPSLPSCRVPNIENGPNVVGVGRLTRRVSIDSSSVLLPEKGPTIGISKLTRRASIDSSMVLPPKYASKNPKQSGNSNSKNRPHRKPELPSIIEPTNTDLPDNQTPPLLDKTKTQKSLTALDIEAELQGFKDLGFTYEHINKKVTPNPPNVPALQRKGSIDSNLLEREKLLKRPYNLSEAWQKQPSSPLSAPPPVPKWADPKAPSADQDMKAQIKFWARAVASNVRQEC